MLRSRAAAFAAGSAVPAGGAAPRPAPSRTAAPWTPNSRPRRPAWRVRPPRRSARRGNGGGWRAPALRPAGRPSARPRPAPRAGRRPLWFRGREDRQAQRARLSNDAARGVADRGGENLELGAGGRQFLDPGERLGQLEAAAIQQLVGLADVGDLLGAETAALEALAVDAARGRRVAAHHHVSGHVLADACVLAHEAVRAGAAELVQAGEAAEDRPVAHLAVAGQRHA